MSDSNDQRDGGNLSNQDGGSASAHGWCPARTMNQLAMAASMYNLTDAVSRYEANKPIHGIVNGDGVRTALRTNDERFTVRDAFGLGGMRWRRKRLLNHSVVVESVAPPYRRTLPAYQADWRYRWSSAPTGVENVVPHQSLLSLAKDVALNPGGYSESFMKMHHNKGQHVRLLAARQWCNRQSYWLSWLGEAFATLALREVGEYLHPFPKIEGEVLKVDGKEKRKWRVGPAPLERVLAGKIVRADLGTASGEDEDWEGDKTDVLSVFWDSKTIGGVPRRGSVYDRKSAGFEDQPKREEVVPHFTLGPGQGPQLRIFFSDHFDRLNSLADSGLVGESVFVSRANTMQGVYQDIIACVVDAVRLFLCGGKTGWGGFTEIVVPGMSLADAKSNASAWSAVPSSGSMSLGSWAYFLWHACGYRWGAGTTAPFMEMTGRDLHAFYRYLTYFRCVGALPYGSKKPDQVGHVGGTCCLVRSHWSVRLCAAMGWLCESAPPFGKAVTYLPSANSLDRALRWFGVRLGQGFDLVTGSIYGLPRNVPKFGGYASRLWDYSVLAFNDAYAIVDGVFIGWAYRHSLALEGEADLETVPDKLEVGTRKCWGVLGYVEGHVPEFETAGEGPPPLASTDDFACYEVAKLSQDQAFAVLVASYEAGATPGVDWVTAYGQGGNVPIEYYAMASHVAADGYTGFTVPLAFLCLSSRRMNGTVEVTKSWSPVEGWWVASKPVATPRLQVRDF